MSLSPGTRLGPYEIVGPIGSGGMGDVYRARDTKLDRQVAIKVLPELFASDPDRVARFQREAKALAALNHPNILAIHDFGVGDGAAYAAMELLEGRTLRERMAEGPLPPRKAAEYAAQIARGLAAAHDRGIVHRDLKPENIAISPDGRVKVLDFGLALHVGAPADASPGDVTRARTDSRVVLGTIGYMSPEQVRGGPIDFRSDIFALGAVLYEMLSGRRAFARDSAAETMSAILRDDPPELQAGDELSASLRGIVQHCLEKAPAERFQSARDLAFALEQVAASSSGPGRALPGTRQARRPGLLPILAVLGALAAGAAIGFGVGRGRAPEASDPAFTRLTFGRGTIRNARFAPDGRTILYGASWDNAPVTIYLGRTDSLDSTPLQLPPAELQAISSRGELALTLGHEYDGWMGEGTLARSPLLAGGARPVVEKVREADWSPDGSELAIVRRAGGRERLEFPVGRVLYETSGYISHIRVSPDGQRVAFVDHPVFGDDIGNVAVVDRDGRRTPLWTGQDSVRGVAWAPGGREVWFTTNQETNSFIRAASLSGQHRVVRTTITRTTIFDIATDGRVLLGNENHLRHVEATAPEHPAELRNYALSREQSIAKVVSPDGRLIGMTDQSFRGYTTYLRRTDGSAPVRVGSGDAQHLSPDRRFILSLTSAPPMRLFVHPVGPGNSRELPNPGEILIENARWLPAGDRVVLFGPAAGARRRGFVQRVDGGAPEPFTPEGVEAPNWWALAVSPDGTRVTARGPDGVMGLWPLDGSAPQPLPEFPADAVPIEWSADGTRLVVARRTRSGWSLGFFDLATGRVTKVRDVSARDPSGLRASIIQATPDAKYVVHSYSRLLVDLYVAEGLK